MQERIYALSIVCSGAAIDDDTSAGILHDVTAIRNFFGNAAFVANTDIVRIGFCLPAVGTVGTLTAGIGATAAASAAVATTVPTASAAAVSAAIATTVPTAAATVAIVGESGRLDERKPRVRQDGAVGQCDGNRADCGPEGRQKNPTRDHNISWRCFRAHCAHGATGNQLTVPSIETLGQLALTEIAQPQDLFLRAVGHLSYLHQTKVREGDMADGGCSGSVVRDLYSYIIDNHWVGTKRRLQRGSR
ncbi:hypothetical protein [Ensifer adhaerens]|uniref:hypothetical protein n=1 Tax=Ensifer adhaerens TaxID=106592 RepID=UPI003158B1AC